MIFRKPKAEEKQPPSGENKPEQPAMDMPNDTPPPPPPPAGEPTASVLTADVVMEGNLVTSGDLQLNGTIHGAVQAARVVIDVNGAVNGQVVAEEIIIRGRVIGPICGVRVHLQPGSQVEGDVMNQSIVVENGAFIDGQIRHSDDPLGEWQQMWYGEEDVAEDAAEPVEESLSATEGAAEADSAPYLRRSTDKGDEAEPAKDDDSPSREAL